MLVPLVRPVHCAPRRLPCPTCGTKGTRVRRLRRRVRSLAYRREAWLDIHYAEYEARCSCCKSFRSCPQGVQPRADYDDSVRDAVLDRLLLDGLNVQRARCAMRRDFLLDLSPGFVYDCLDWRLRCLDLPGRRRRTLEGFSGVLCVDELHLGRHTLLLATDPVADEVVGFALVRANDQAHMRRFLLMLKHWGFLPQVVVSDGSNLYPAALAEVWPAARHQLCVFHVVQDITRKVLDAVRRLRRQKSRRGNAGRKPRRGGAGKRAKGRGPSNREKAAFVFKRRYLVVKRLGNLSEQEHEDLGRMFEYLPELRTLHRFMQEVYQLWQDGQSLAVARWRYARLAGNEEYRGVPELAEVLRGLGGEKHEKTQAFLSQPPGCRQKTNNHAERMNRRLRFDEKVRYKFRRRKALVRWVILKVSLHRPAPQGGAEQATQGQPAPPPPPS